jgi:hypothetical protein
MIVRIMTMLVIMFVIIIVIPKTIIIDRETGLMNVSKTAVMINSISAYSAAFAAGDAAAM